MANSSSTDQSPKYWSEYSNLQHIKHSLIRNYLNGWFPKLVFGKWGEGRITYVDTHAGRGHYIGGQVGSPLVALETLLAHTSRAKLLQKSQIDFLFIERDQKNADCLKEELTVYEPLPNNVSVDARSGDSFEIMRKVVESLEAGGRSAPSFIFVDPYGFKIPGDLLCRLMQFKKVELFVNVIWRELDMAIRQGDDMDPGMKSTLDTVFNGGDWLAISSDDSDERAEQCVNTFREMTGARWATYIRMLGSNRKTRYFLLHLTNHDAGRDLMKQCVWKCCPDGGYYARKTDDPRQQMLILPKPDLSPLQNWVIDHLRSGPERWENLEKCVRQEMWLPTHLNEVVRSLYKEGTIKADLYSGRFARKNNPRIFIDEKSNT